MNARVGLRGTITKRGKSSYRVELSLGKKNGRYEKKRETVRGTEKQAIDLLTRWNVELLDNSIIQTTHQTLQQAYAEWIKTDVKPYLAPNTVAFYRQRFERDILPKLGEKKLKDVTLADMQRVLAAKPGHDSHNKRALSAFMNWCVNDNRIKENPCRKLRLSAKEDKRSEQDVWTFEQVRKVYAAIDWSTLYGIFIPLGIECGLRPQEILGLTWDAIHEDHIVISHAIKQRTTTEYILGPTKTKKTRLVLPSPYLLERLQVHRINQQIHEATTKRYVDRHLVVADTYGHVPLLDYINKHMRVLAERAGVHRIPPKNLRSTHISLLSDMRIPTVVIQEHVGHESPDMINRHYVRAYSASLAEAMQAFNEKLHS